MKRASISIAVAIAFATSFVYGRPVQMWKYDDLKEKAEVVLVAESVKTEELAEVADLPNIYSQDASGQRVALQGVGLNSTFKVLTVFKGELEGSEIILHHYRQKDLPKTQINGPSLVGFDTKTPAQYLMFLKRESDGRFVAVSGQTDPADSIKKLL